MELLAQTWPQENINPLENHLALFKLIDSNYINTNAYKIDRKYEKIAIRKEPNKINVAFYTNDKNKWCNVYLEEYQFTVDYKLVDFDKNNFPELVYYWQEFNYGPDGGNSIDCISVIKLDSIPIQIFKMVMGCNDESFGDKSKNGEGAYYNTYIRGVKVLRDMLIIDENDKKKYPFEKCPITTIPSGTYKMIQGQFVKLNQ